VWLTWLTTSPRIPENTWMTFTARLRAVYRFPIVITIFLKGLLSVVEWLKDRL
jgi:hypothetical protein